MPVKSRSKITVKAGKDLKLRATLENGSASRKVAVTVPTKARWSGSRGVLDLVGGGSAWSGSFWGADTLQQVQDVADNWIRNDQVEAMVGLDLGRKWVEQDSASAPTDSYVKGHRRYKLIVK
ncbi:MAG: hypothetical protein R2731_04720 [Nocardioides sp.]